MVLDQYIGVAFPQRAMTLTRDMPGEAFRPRQGAMVRFNY
jgi:hypothetical protein